MSDAVAGATRAQFGAVAARYVHSSYHATGPDLAALVAAARLQGGERVLDTGTGTGHTALAIAAAGADEVIGIDITGEMLEQAAGLARQRGLANVRFEAGDAHALPFEDGSFDLVTSRQASHHYADPPRAVAEAWRVLRPGGVFVLVDTVAPEEPALDTFLNCFELLRDGSHVRDWRASEWVRMFRAEGFAVEVLDRYPIPLDGADWVTRMRTPAVHVEAIRALFRAASPSQRAAFELRDEPWGLTLTGSLFRAMKPAT